MPSPWKVVAASVVGSSHLKTDLPCQDAHGYFDNGEGLLFIVAADGAGSAAKSHLGAQTAVAVALEFVKETCSNSLPGEADDWETLVRDTFEQARRAVMQLAEQEVCSPRELATTLTLVAAGPGWLATGLVGDGLVVARMAGEVPFTAAFPQRGEFANETNFITMENAPDLVDFQFFPLEVDSLALMTDGLLRLAVSLPDLTPYPPFFEPLLNFPRAALDEAEARFQLDTFLKSDRVNARTDDDKTLVLAARS